jgi:nucleotide-binding universal stress UspA family protein
MFQRIIVGCDPGPGALDAVRLGHELADLAPGTQLTLAHVHRPAGPQLGRRHGEVTVPDRPPDASLRLLESLADRVPAECRADVVLTSVRASSAAAGLHHLVRTTEADLLVLGPARHGTVGRLVLGSDSVGIVHGAPCPVAIPPRTTGQEHLAARGDETLPVGAAYDGTDVAVGAAELAARLAAALDRPLDVVSVAPPPGHEEPPTTELHAPVSVLLPDYDPQDADTDLREALEERIDALPAAARARPVLLHGDPARAIVEHSHALDLLVVSRDHGPIRHVLLGGVSRPVLDNAYCPVIVVPRSARQEPSFATQGPASETAGRRTATR